MRTMVSMDPMPTTISLASQTKEALRALGEKGESYDDIIRRLIKETGLKRLDARWNKILEQDGFIPLDDL